MTLSQDSAAAADVPPAVICVYCGSSPGTDPVYMETARELARVMAKNKIRLVYGGGTVGLMGELAKTLVALSGPDFVHGIIPEPLVRYERGNTATNTTDTTTAHAESVFGRTTVVKDMHTRKKLMAQEVFDGGPGSGFLALPGGFGTMEEVMETTTWNQLGIHQRGICLLNVAGYYDGITTWIRHSIASGFVRDSNFLLEAFDVETAVRLLYEYEPSPVALKLEWGEQ